jgi:hypothetical protein
MVAPSTAATGVLIRKAMSRRHAASRGDGAILISAIVVLAVVSLAAVLTLLTD